MSINLSARDVMDDTLPDRVAGAAAGARLRGAVDLARDHRERDPRRPGHAVENLKRLSALGCKLSIDDYGTGYSSLAYLRRLPLHELKIDKSFVMGMVRDASDDVIVRSTIDLAHNMGLVVVAEGVEDEATLERLRALGCDMVQGYFLSRPLPADQVLPCMRGAVAARWASRRRCGASSSANPKVELARRLDRAPRLRPTSSRRRARFVTNIKMPTGDVLCCPRRASRQSPTA